MKKFLVVFVSVLTIISGFSQNMTGLVLEMETYKPITNANVRINEVEKNETMVAYTDTNGLFSYNATIENTVVISLEHPDYFPVTKTIKVSKEWLKQNAYFKLIIEPVDKTLIQTPISEVADVGLVDELPEGYKILKTKPINGKLIERSGFNVQRNSHTYNTNVNIGAVKNANEQKLQDEMPEGIREERFGTAIFKNSNVYYEPGKAELSKEVLMELDVAVDMLEEREDLVLNVIGYADADKEASIADYVSKLRVDIITSYLMNHNVPFDQLNVSARGNKFLENECYQNADCTYLEHAENRKVELYYDFR